LNTTWAGVYTNMVVSDATIRELCEQGRVCAVVGHVWDRMPMLYVDQVGFRRVCLICKRVEVRREEWKAVE